MPWAIGDRVIGRWQGIWRSRDRAQGEMRLAITISGRQERPSPDRAIAHALPSPDRPIDYRP